MPLIVREGYEDCWLKKDKLKIQNRRLDVMPVSKVGILAAATQSVILPQNNLPQNKIVPLSWWQVHFFTS